MIPARHHEVFDFQHFFGDKKGQLWLSILRKDGLLFQIKNLHKIPLVTDIHVVRANIALGVVYGSYSGQISLISQKIRELWEDVFGETQIEGKGMTIPELSELFRTLSKNGCTHRDGKRGICPYHAICPFHIFCVNGIFSLENKGALIDTIPGHLP